MAAVASTAAVLVVDFTGEASAVALSTAVAFVVAILGGATSAIADSLITSSSAATVIRVGRTGIIHTVITVTRTITMDTADTHMVTTDTVTMAGPVTDTAMAVDQTISGVREVGNQPLAAALRNLPPVSACLITTQTMEADQYGNIDTE